MFKTASNKNQNIGILVIFSGSAILFLLSYLFDFSLIFLVISYICTISGISISSIFTKKNFQKIEIVENQGLVEIERKNEYNLLQSRPGITILTGRSGSGKSILLSQWQKQLASKNKKIFFINNNYNSLSKKDLEGEYDYIILDQLERAIWTDVISDNTSIVTKYSFNNVISDDILDNVLGIIGSIYHKTPGCHIILSVRKEFAMDIYDSLLRQKIKKPSFFLLDNRSINESLKRQLIKYFGETEKGVEKTSMTGTILKDAKNEKISVIQIDNICKRVGEVQNEDIYVKWENTNGNYDELVRHFLISDLNNIAYTKNAYEILYLLSLDSKHQYKYALSDFQNITILPREQLEDLVEYLISQKWIERSRDTNQDIGRVSTHGKLWADEFEMTHDYYQEQFNKIAIEQLDPQIRKNIDYYHSNCLRLKGTREVESLVYKINIKCKNYIKPRSKIYIDIMLYVLLLICASFSIFQLHEKAGDMHNIIWIFLNIAIGGSILYVYNYYYHFLSFFGLRYVYIPIIGILACLYIYLNSNLWGFALGLEVSSVGVATWSVRLRCRNQEKKYFRNKGIIFFLIGVVTCILGLMFPFYTHDDIKLMLPLFTLYIAYISIGAKGHITEINLRAIIGMVLFNTEKGDYM